MLASWLARLPATFMLSYLSVLLLLPLTHALGLIGDPPTSEATKRRPPSGLEDALERRKDGQARRLANIAAARQTEEAARHRIADHIQQRLQERDAGRAEWVAKASAQQRDEDVDAVGVHSHQKLLAARLEEQRLRGWLPIEALRQLSAAERSAAPDLRRGVKNRFTHVDNTPNATEQVIGLPESFQDERFERIVNGIQRKVIPNVAYYVSNANADVDEFVNSTRNVSSDEFMPLLGVFLNITVQRYQEHRSSSAKLLLPLAHTSGAFLSRLLQTLQLVVDADITVNDTDISKISKSRPSLGCAALLSVLAKVAPFHNKFTQARRALNVSAQGMAAFASDSDHVTAEAEIIAKNQRVMGIARSIVSTSYVEFLGLQEIANAMTLRLGPAIENKLHCGFVSASRHVGLVSGIAILIVYCAAFFDAGAR